MDAAARRCKILYIHASAGYGKTTAAAQWLAGRKAVWLSLDQYTQDSAEYLLDFTKKTDEWPEAFVIDNFHHYTEPSAVSALALIRTRIPARVYLVVISRTPPPESLTEQVIKGEVAQITGLGFNADEVVMLFSKKGRFITRYAAELLCRQTDGWAAALAAILRSGVDGCSGVRNLDGLNRYIRNLFSDAAYYEDLQKCAICHPLNRELCIAVTGNHFIWEAIADLSKKTGLIELAENGTAEFHKVVREFLEDGLRRDDTLDRPLLYKKAAMWYKASGDILRAFGMAFKSGDICVMEEISCVRGKAIHHSSVNVSHYAQFIESNLLPLSAMIAEACPSLSVDCYIAARLTRPASEAHRWADIVEGHIRKGLLCRKDWIRADYTPSLTYNFPFFHRAQKDYAYIAPKLYAYTAYMTVQAESILGPLSKTLASLVEAGILYECGRLGEAEIITGKLAKNENNLSAEIFFCVYALLTEIRRVSGKKTDPERIGVMIERMGADYLHDNYRAFITVTQLYQGVPGAADEWLEREHPIRTPCIHSIFRDFVTAKALFSSGKLSAAEDLLEKLVCLSWDYRRYADYVEALTLLSIVKWQRNRKKEAVAVMAAALAKAGELCLVMPVAREGRDVQPILQKISGRIKYGYDKESLDRLFVSILCEQAQNVSKYVPGLSTGRPYQPIRLSARQAEVLGYLKQNMSYKEIAAIMQITTATVDDHIRKLHEKLNASTTKELLRNARELL
jgi:ATP/maltotriose-dependent transcriptional regulator MalT